MNRFWSGHTQRRAPKRPRPAQRRVPTRRPANRCCVPYVQLSLRWLAVEPVSRVSQLEVQTVHPQFPRPASYPAPLAQTQVHLCRPFRRLLDGVCDRDEPAGGPRVVDGPTHTCPPPSDVTSSSGPLPMLLAAEAQSASTSVACARLANSMWDGGASISPVAQEIASPR